MKFTIFGNPVSHSKSPQMHNAGLDFLNITGHYDKTHLNDGKHIKDLFIQRNLQGANITVPHKEAAFNNADEIRGMANKIGAVNTYIKENNKVIAYNTDAPGFMEAIKEFGKIDTALILGAGGTSKAIAVAFKEAGINTIVVNRSRKNRLEFFEELGCECFDWEEVTNSIESIATKLSFGTSLVVNSTSAGLKDEKLPIDEPLLNQILKNANFAIDCIYGKVTPFLQKAKDMDIKIKDGEDMLLYQGVIAFELFTNTKADKSLVETMRKALNS